MKKESVRHLRRIDFLLILTTISIGLVLRLYPYRANLPIAGYHGARQAEVSSVARNFVEHGFDVLHPKGNNLSSIKSGRLDNPNGYQFTDFPIYSALFASGFRYLPLLSLEDWGRAVSVFFSLIAIFTIYYFLYKEQGRRAAVAGSLIYAIFPFFVFYSRVILPDTMALGLMFAALFFLYSYSESTRATKKVLYFITSAILFTLAVLTKPYVAIYSIGGIFLFVRIYGWNFYKKFQFYLYFLTACLPSLAWQIYIQGYPEATSANTWLVHSGVSAVADIKSTFFNPHYIQTIFYDRINNLIFGGYLFVFFILGILTKLKKHFLYSLLAAAILYLVIFQVDNLNHIYNQVLILPALAVFAGLGVASILSDSKARISRVYCWIIIIALSTFSFFISYKQVAKYYTYSPDIVKIANILTDLTATDDKIVTDTGGDMTLLYLAGRRGSPLHNTSFEELKRQGYTYFLTTKKNISEAEIYSNQLEIIFENDKFTLIKISI